MSTNPEHSTLHELMSRLAALEQSHASLHKELTSLRGARAATDVQEQTAATAPATTTTQGTFASSIPGTAAVTASGNTGATGVQATSDSGFGVFGQSTSLTGVGGQSSSGIGVQGSGTDTGTGVSGQSNKGTGIFGQSVSGLAGEFFGNVKVSGSLKSGTGTFDSIVQGTPAVTANATNGATGVSGSSDSGFGVVGQSSTFTGVLGTSSSGIGVQGTGGIGPGVVGRSGSGPGVLGESSGLAGEFVGNVSVSGTLSSGAGTFASSGANTAAITAKATNGATGVSGSSDSGPGVVGHGTSLEGVFGVSTSGVGVRGQSTSGIGIVGVSSSGPAGEFFGDVTVTRTLSTGTLSSGAGIFATSGANTPAVTASGINGASGVQASSDSGLAGEFTGNVSVSGNLSGGTGTFATSEVSTSAITVTATNGASGVQASSDSGTGIAGHSLGGPGVVGTGGGPGAAAIFGFNDLAGEFSGNVTISGSLSKAGGGFQIDHPLDPAHKYLCHSFVESPEMKNLYDGVVTLDAQGQAEVALPSWFAALNADFRYLLTAIGTAAPNLYIAKEITGCGFKIAGGQPGMKVSWQVSAVRQDAWANAHRIVVEQDKPAKEQSFYLHPELYGQPEQQNVVWVRYPNLPRTAVTR